MMDYYLLADLAARLGCQLALAGAETFRVEDTVRRILRTYGVECEVFAIPNSLTVSFEAANGKPLTIMKRIGYHGNDLEALEQLNARIQETGGYVESQNITGRSSGSSRNRYAYLTVRVPAQKLDGFIENVSGVTNVVSSSRYVEDITLSYTDTEGRVKALKTEEARLLELMEQAQNMSDLLEIEARLTEVRYQLENYTSTLRLYDNQVDYATVELRVTEVEKYTPAEEPGFWAKITQGLSQSIVDLGRAIVDFISWLIIDLPYLAVIALLAWLGVGLTRRSIRRRKAKKQARKEKTGEETPN